MGRSGVGAIKLLFFVPVRIGAKDHFSAFRGRGAKDLAPQDSNTLIVTPTCRSHSSTALHETYIASQRNLDMCRPIDEAVDKD